MADSDCFLTDLNVQGGIGANCLLLRLGPFHFVIDTGLHPKETGPAALPSFARLRNKDIDLIFVTHCHLDHLAALPVLLRDHPKTQVIMSYDSFQIYKRLLKNSCNVMERQMEESGGKTQPLYSFRDIRAASRQIVPMGIGIERNYQSFYGDRITFSLHSAGHIPGAVGILFEYQKRKIFHTSDVLFQDTPMLDGANFPEVQMDALILETTRGQTERLIDTTRETETTRLIDCMRSTLAQGGSVLIPVFALGRMQELLTVFLAARRSGELSRYPIYVSGLGIDLLNGFDKIARNNPNLRVRKEVMQDLGAEKLPQSHRPGQNGPAIYLLSSGMMTENTPSYTAAAELLGSPHNTICFVGYCDPDTPGGKLQQARPGSNFLFKAIGKKVPMAAKIERFDLSSHADREELLAFAIARKPRYIVLTHGDPEARTWFREQLGQQLPKCTIIDPAPLIETAI